MDIVEYAARGCPSLKFDTVASYAPTDSQLVSSADGEFQVLSTVGKRLRKTLIEIGRRAIPQIACY
jgi:hypothetical protein